MKNRLNQCLLYVLQRRLGFDYGFVFPQLLLYPLKRPRI